MEPRLTLFGRQSRGARRCPAIPPLDDHLIADLRTQSAHLVFICDRSWSAARNSSRCRTFRSRARRLRRYTEPCACTAVAATVLTMSATRAPRDRSLTGLFRPLQNRPDCHRVGAALYGLVGVVTGVQVGKDQHCRPAGHLRIRQLGRGNTRIHRGVVLNGAGDQNVGPQRVDEMGCCTDFFHVRSAPRRAGRVRQHGDPRLSSPPWGNRCSASSTNCSVVTTPPSGSRPRPGRRRLEVAHALSPGCDSPGGGSD
jgi:hypothetical protein